MAMDAEQFERMEDELDILAKQKTSSKEWIHFIDQRITNERKRKRETARARIRIDLEEDDNHIEKFTEKEREYREALLEQIDRTERMVKLEARMERNTYLFHHACLTHQKAMKKKGIVIFAPGSEEWLQDHFDRNNVTK